MTDIFKRPIILAADVQTPAELYHIFDTVAGNPHVIVKVGLEFITAHGTATLASMLHGPYYPPIMLDLKLADIGNTNAKTLENLLTHHFAPAILTVSGLGAGGKGIRAVRDVLNKTQAPTKLVATTILTNWDAHDAMDIAPLPLEPEKFDMGEWARDIALTALTYGAHGTVSSGHEAEEMRKLGAELVITPGIRPTWAADAGDQARVMTPTEAFAAGATHIVIGRPVLQAKKFGLTPAQAIDKLVAEHPRLAA